MRIDRLRSALICITAVFIISLSLGLQANAADSDTDKSSGSTESDRQIVTLRAGLYTQEYPSVFNALRRPSYNQLNELLQ